jgi:hypothetical protein
LYNCFVTVAQLNRKSYGRQDGLDTYSVSPAKEVVSVVCLDTSTVRNSWVGVIILVPDGSFTKELRFEVIHINIEINL